MTLRALPGARTGADVVPGVPARVAELAEQLEAMARGLAAMHEVLAHLGTDGWAGAAATAAAGVLAAAPSRYADAAAAMHRAGCAVSEHALVLAAAQRRADEAVALDEAGAARTAAWQRERALHAELVHRTAAGDPGAAAQLGGAAPALVDPGAALRTEAGRLAAGARRRARASAQATAHRLRAAARTAPEQPNLLARAAHALDDLRHDVELGVAQAVTQQALLASRFVPWRLAADPLGVAADARATGSLLLDELLHPAATAALMLDLPTLADDPGRWLGHLAPDVALGAATAGAGAVAARAAALPVRAVARAGPTALRAPVRETLAVQQATSRSALRLRDLHSYRSGPDAFGAVTRLDPAGHGAARTVLRDARWAEPLITRRVHAVATRLGGRLDGTEHVRKASESLYRKVAAEQLRQRRSVPLLTARLNDTIRYTVTFGERDYVHRAVQTVHALRASGFELAEVKSSWGGPRYQGLNLTLHDPQTGRLFEVQVHTPHSRAASVRTHAAYELFRSDGVDPVVRERLREEIAAEFAKAPPPAGATALRDRLQALVTVDGSATVPRLRSPAVGTGVLAASGAATGSSLAWGDGR